MNLKIQAKLDPQFQPMSLVCREMREKTKDNGQDIVIAVERNKGYTSTYKTLLFKDNTGARFNASLLLNDENFTFVGAGCIGENFGGLTQQCLAVVVP